MLQSIALLFYLFILTAATKLQLYRFNGENLLKIFNKKNDACGEGFPNHGGSNVTSIFGCGKNLICRKEQRQNMGVGFVCASAPGVAYTCSSLQTGCKLRPHPQQNCCPGLTCQLIDGYGVYANTYSLGMGSSKGQLPSRQFHICLPPNIDKPKKAKDKPKKAKRAVSWVFFGYYNHGRPKM